MWPSKPVWQYDRYYCNSNGKPGVFDHAQSEETWLWTIETTNDNRKWQYDHQNQKYLYLWNYDRQEDNSNSKSGVFDHAQRKETDPRQLRRWPTTVSGNMATKTRNTYMSRTMVNRMTVLPTNYGFTTTPRLQKLTLGDCDNDRRPDLLLQYEHFARQCCNFWLTVVVAFIWLVFCHARHHRKSRIWHWNFNCAFHCLRDISISSFGRHFQLSLIIGIT